METKEPKVYREYGERHQLLQCKVSWCWLLAGILSAFRLMYSVGSVYSAIDSSQF